MQNPNLRAPRWCSRTTTVKAEADARCLGQLPCIANRMSLKRTTTGKLCEHRLLRARSPSEERELWKQLWKRSCKVRRAAIFQTSLKRIGRRGRRATPYTKVLVNRTQEDVGQKWLVFVARPEELVLAGRVKYGFYWVCKGKHRLSQCLFADVLNKTNSIQHYWQVTYSTRLPPYYSRPLTICRTQQRQRRNHSLGKSQA